MIHLRLAVAVVLAVPALPAAAHEYKLESLDIIEPRTRATPSTAQTGSGYLAITNKSTAPDRLITAKSSAANKVEIHEMKMDGSVMRMRELDKGLEVPPGATVQMKPSGIHLMFVGLKAPFARHTKIPVTLVFEKAGSIDVEMVVAAMGAAAVPAHQP